MYNLLNWFIGFITNKMILAPIISCTIAQIIKIIVDSYRSGFSKERLYFGGGMPSTHGAGLTSFVIITAAYCGPSSFEFALALILAVVVLYDEVGVRFESQRQGKALNNLNYEREEEGKQPLDVIKFKEKIGHTLPELLAGMFIGIVGVVVVYFLPF